VIYEQPDANAALTQGDIVDDCPILFWQFSSGEAQPESAGAGVAESIVDLRDLHTIPRALLENLIKVGKRVARIRIPFREHLAQHISTT